MLVLPRITSSFTYNISHLRKKLSGVLCPNSQFTRCTKGLKVTSVSATVISKHRLWFIVVTDEDLLSRIILQSQYSGVQMVTVTKCK